MDKNKEMHKAIEEAMANEDLEEHRKYFNPPPPIAYYKQKIAEAITYEVWQYRLDNDSALESARYTVDLFFDAAEKAGLEISIKYKDKNAI